jgi:hypothetical protein
MNSRRRIGDLLRWIREPIPDEDEWKRLRRCSGDRTKGPFAALLEFASAAHGVYRDMSAARQSWRCFPAHPLVNLTKLD